MWVNTQNNQVVLFHSEIRASKPEISLPEVLTDELIESLGFAPVLPGLQPTYNAATQKLVDAPPAKFGNTWMQQWAVVSLSREELKAARAAAVAAIKVTTAAGNTFDGDEISQSRMARAIIALGAAPAGTTVNWVLSDNTVILATPAELTEALLLAGSAQAALWVI